MKSAQPKQFLPLDGRPLLMHTIERFHACDDVIEIIVVLPEEHQPLWRRLLKEHSFTVSHQVVSGGEERFHSVKAGLKLIRDESLVAIHDGVRPLVSHDTIWRCFADAEEYGSAVPFIEPADTVRLQAGNESQPFPRNDVRLIQTPQVFRSDLLISSYDRDYDASFTDDAMVVEAAGIKIHLTHGNRENIKITTPEDLVIARALMRMLKQG
jgi:2-C-methyl-D-erythritol 4-phosphate cytidylyltransferase